jgi:hypothetical protein
MFGDAGEESLMARHERPEYCHDVFGLAERAGPDVEKRLRVDLAPLLDRVLFEGDAESIAELRACLGAWIHDLHYDMVEQRHDDDAPLSADELADGISADELVTRLAKFGATPGRP